MEQNYASWGSKDSVTGLMCGAALGLSILADPLSALGAAPAIGCLIGLIA
ncbi:hypothetical protein SMI01S_26420 [Sphingobacterium mizutaii NBRC 14946 = DSM 11724]|uniref:Uncharacterized protein n=2 Tax=Sphingobacterium mizutaii TaxID=1010 RepID=A0AAJ4XC43_9SPHI|nr:hypothetical protein [Sphingobacterium mizutaii]GEM69036.1 hypothetical protein SMI01S_26420 [Sphingobacterium mizutaii NBRC 14946 = DSM 11724]SDK92942.1 hypothetical protein SAMN05192578_101379 [Sphingobacterium mizutaii]SNV48154.1 Uncharacterised protein [Sphingobacterium mizutaii]